MLQKMVEMRCAPAGEMHGVRGPKAMESLAIHEMTATSYPELLSVLYFCLQTTFNWGFQSASIIQNLSTKNFTGELKIF